MGVKFINRREIPVTVYAKVIPDDVTIRPGMVTNFELTADGEILATCESSRRLSDWAFQNGALRVRHDFDLRLAEGEL